MYGKDVKEWLREEQPEAYDFTKEIVKSIGIEDAVDRYVLYQATGFKKIAEDSILKKHEVFSWSGHADGCKLIKEIYGILWPEALLLHCMASEGIKGDTMNSCNTTINQLIMCLIKKPERGFNLDKGIENELKEPKSKWSIQKTVLQYSIDRQHDSKDDSKENTLTQALRNYKELASYLNVVYTIGNFIPVPVGCNSPRGAGPTKDYWDLALLAIFQWYMKRDDAMLKNMLQNREDKVALYINWLDCFGSWDQFIVANFMQDFVNEADQKDKGVFGKPKELWDGHFDCIKVSPAEGRCFEIVFPKEEQFTDFFSRATAWISARSIRMVNALRAKGNIE